jgi:hypothetical protein
MPGCQSIFSLFSAVQALIQPQGLEATEKSEQLFLSRKLKFELLLLCLKFDTYSVRNVVNLARSEECRAFRPCIMK